MTLPEASRFPHSLEVVEDTGGEIRLTTPTRIDYSTAMPRDPQVKQRVRRKLQGILLRFVEDEALVAFESGNESFEYYLNASLLRRNGVTAVQQPFELIEGERTLPGPQVEQFTRLLPLAPAKSAVTSALTLPKETREKLRIVFAKLRPEK
jgi:hypothetical protein